MACDCTPSPKRTYGKILEAPSRLLLADPTGAGHEGVLQFGRLRFFKNAGQRGSLRKFSSIGSKFVKATLPSR